MKTNDEQLPFEVELAEPLDIPDEQDSPEADNPVESEEEPGIPDAVPANTAEQEADS